MNRRHARSLILIAAASGVLTACSKPDPGMGETRKLIMGTFTEDSVTDRAGKPWRRPSATQFPESMWRPGRQKAPI